MIDANPETTFVFIRIDIDRFSLINSFWGEEEGDRLLKYVADCLRSESTAFEICTYSHGRLARPARHRRRRRDQGTI